MTQEELQKASNKLKMIYGDLKNVKDFRTEVASTYKNFNKDTGLMTDEIYLIKGDELITFRGEMFKLDLERHDYVVQYKMKDCIIVRSSADSKSALLRIKDGHIERLLKDALYFFVYGIQYDIENIGFNGLEREGLIVEYLVNDNSGDIKRVRITSDSVEEVREYTGIEYVKTAKAQKMNLTDNTLNIIKMEVFLNELRNCDYIKEVWFRFGKWNVIFNGMFSTQIISTDDKGYQDIYTPLNEAIFVLNDRTDKVVKILSRGHHVKVHEDDIKKKEGKLSKSVKEGYVKVEITRDEVREENLDDIDADYRGEIYTDPDMSSLSIKYFKEKII